MITESPPKMSTFTHPDYDMSLWKRYESDRSNDNRNAIVCHYLQIAEARALRMKQKLPTTIQLDDLRSAAFVGLIRAVERFNPNLNTKFETFCSQRVDGAMIDWVRAVDPTGRFARTFERKRNKSQWQFYSEHGRMPDYEELTELIGYSQSQMEKYTAIVETADVVMFSEIEKEDYYSDPPDKRVILDEESRLNRESFRQRIKSLSPAERLSIILYFEEELTMREVAESIGCSESRVSQIMTRAKLKLAAEENENQTNEITKYGVEIGTIHRRSGSRKVQRNLKKRHPSQVDACQSYSLPVKSELQITRAAG